jgi:hypothetical protein
LPVILAAGEGSELYGIDPSQFGRKGAQWLSGAKALIAGPLEDNPGKPSWLLAGADGLTAYQVAFPGAGNRMVVRRIALNPVTRKSTTDEREMKLPEGALPAGPPAIVGNSLMLTLTTGTFFRVVLDPLAAAGKELSNWRNGRFGSDVRGYVSSLGSDRMVATDGGKGLTFWELGDQVMTGLFPSDKPDEESGFQLDDRVAAPPLLLAQASGTNQALLVADAGGLLRTIVVTAKGPREDKQLSWDLKGRVTAGPFLNTVGPAGPRVFCIVDGNRVVWLDPHKSQQIEWQYATKGAAIVGEPQVIDGRLVVADQAGGIVALDLATGKSQGKGYTLPGSIAPAAPPVAFSSDKMLVSLTDGTALLLPLELFR